MKGHSLSEDGLLKTNSIFYINTQVVILGARRSLINHVAIFGMIAVIVAVNSTFLRNNNSTY